MVKPNDKISIDKIAGEVGAPVVFDKVLLTADGDKVEIGKPYLQGIKVEGKVLEQGRADKILVMKYRAKTRYRRKKGHRQHFTKVEITKI